MNIFALDGSLPSNGVQGGGAATGTPQFDLRIGPFVTRELEVISFKGRERLSAPFVYGVTFASSLPPEVLQAGISGFPACLGLRVVGQSPRVVQGLAVAFGEVGVFGGDLRTKTRRYCAKIVPRLWLLQHRRTHRIFQNQSAIQIACAVLADAGIQPRIKLLSSQYPPLPCVYQRGETDLDFLHRVLATAGVFYWFEHASGFLEALLPIAPGTVGAVAGLAGAAAGAVGGALGTVVGSATGAAESAGELTVLVLSDETRYTSAIGTGAAVAGAAGAAASELGPALGGAFAVAGDVVADVAAALAGPDAIPFDGSPQASPAAERVFKFRVVQEVRPKGVHIRDWNLAKTTAVDQQGTSSPLQADAEVDVGFSFSGPPTVATHMDVKTDALPIATADLTVYEYQRDAGLLAAPDDGAARALAQLRSDWITARGETNSRRLAPGYRFRLAGHPIEPVNMEYVVTELRCEGNIPDRSPDRKRPLFWARFHAVPRTIDPKPKKPSSLPPDLGPEPAVVVGGARGDVSTDAIGRIQVKFRWSRPGRDDEATCWVHWLERWGGHGYGTQSIPRVGSEVLVDFPRHEGGIPIAVGQLHSARIEPPFALPQEAHLTGTRSRTIPNGPGYNEFVFDDRPGEERVRLRAQRDHEVDVLGDQTTHVRGDQRLHVLGDVHERLQADHEREVSGKMTSKVVGTVRDEVGKDRAAVTGGSFEELVVGDVSRVVMGRVQTVTHGLHEDVYRADSIERHHGDRAVVVVPAGEDESASTVLHVQGAARAYAKGAIEAVSGEAFELTCGESHVSIRKDSITFSSPTIAFAAKTFQVTATDAVTVTAKTTTIASSDTVTVRGANKATVAGKSASVVLDSDATVEGSKVNLGSPTPLASSSQQRRLAKKTTVALTDASGAPLAHRRVLLRKGGEAGEERMVVLDAEGMIEVDEDESFDVRFVEDAQAKR